MAALEERLAFLEGRVVEHSRAIDGIREAVVSLEQRMDRRFQSLEERMDRGFQASDERMVRGFKALDDKISRQFNWIVGIFVATLTAMVTALAALIVQLV